MLHEKHIKLWIDTAIEAAIEAGAVIMKIYKNEIEVVFKADESPLTLADQKANACIESKLKPLGIPIISEETKQLPFDERKNWSSCWIVDPLDGTKEFIKKNDEFTVNIALVENGKPKFGVIYAPALGELYYGLVDDREAYKAKVTEGTTVSDIIQSSQKIGPKKDATTIRVVGSRSHMNEETTDFIEQLEQNSGKKVSLISKGSSLKLCLVAEGAADVYPRFAPTMEWDIAAGHAICNAVGLRVVQQNSTQELQYNKENLLNPYFSIAND
ncbi:3'(2'),5'-bisphosphate nucleotidase CysQ [Flavobacterium sp. XGLA_31]|uniref:3'(2'),5'-bisphosphate nucleotidase CysQ n=1 Tax=Flavobacterium sp. XGLA_31 TaxID=3447666 RepID=UPI003F2C6BF4